MIDTKSIFLSKTFWGAVISLLAQFVPQLFAKFGASADATGQAVVVGWVVMAVGFGWTVYGRFAAKQVVTLTGGPVVVPPVAAAPFAPAINPSIPQTASVVNRKGVQREELP